VRRAAGVLAAVALALAVIAAVTGLVLASSLREGVVAGIAVLPAAHQHPLGLAHVASGLAASTLSVVTAAMLLLMGLEGLLESERRRSRVLPVVLTVLAPTLAALGLGASVSGATTWRDVHLGRLRQAPFEEFVRVHGVLLGGSLLAVLAGLAIARVARRRRSDDDESPEDD